MSRFFCRYHLLCRLDRWRVSNIAFLSSETLPDNVVGKLPVSRFSAKENANWRSCISESQMMKHILIASVGGAPQIVTETLWAMMHPHKMLSVGKTRREPVVPDEIIMLTTAFPGLFNAFKTKEERLIKTREKINELYTQYGHPPPKINSDKSQVVRTPDGKDIEDIRDHVQNSAFADAVVAVMTGIQKRRKKEELVIHISLAGGRKTMSSYLHWAAQWYGTEKDDLTHVLVENLNLEGNPDFWWPDQAMKTVRNRAGQEFSTTAQMDAEGNVGDAARLDLVSVPFDPLGRSIPGIDQKHVSFDGLNAYLEWERNSGPIVFHIRTRRITAGSSEFSLKPHHFAVLYLAAKARKEDWQSPFDNQIEGLRGNVLSHDLHYGADAAGMPVTNRARETVAELYSEWEEYWRSQEIDFDRLVDIITQSAKQIPPTPRDKGLRTPLGDALRDLNRALGIVATTQYVPAVLRGLKQTVSKKKIALTDGYNMSTTYFGFDFPAERIEFADD